jgi:hypothetical protein
MRPDPLIKRLFELPAEIQAAGEALLQATEALEVAKDALQHEESLLLNETTPEGEKRITGTNEALRRAQLAILTAPQRERVAAKRGRAERLKLTLTRAQNDFSAARAVARLLAAQGETEDSHDAA